MITDDLYAIHRDVHRAHDRAGAIRFAGGLSSFDREHTKQVCNSQHRAVRTGILAPRSFDEDREYERGTEDEQGGGCDLGAPEVEERKVGVVRFEDELSACGSDV